MLSCHDRAVCQSRQAGIVEFRDGLWHVAIESQFQHLIEIAVVQIPLPVDRQRGPAHQRVERRRVERLHQRLHVVLVLLGLKQIVQKAADGHVGDRVQPREFDPVTLTQRCR